MAWGVGAFLLLGAVSQPEKTKAQEPRPTVRGSVIDTLTGEGVPGVLIRLPWGPAAPTGSEGEFVLEDLPVGNHPIAIVTPRCRVSFASLSVRSTSQPLQVFQIPPVGPQGVDPPTVPLPGSRVLNRTQIGELHVATFPELIQRVSPGLIRSTSGQPGRQSRIASPTVPSAMGANFPVLVLDGVNLGPMDSGSMWDLVQPSDIEFLEVFRGAAGGWAYGTGASGGVIRVTRKRGGATMAPGLDPARCPIPGWGHP